MVNGNVADEMNCFIQFSTSNAASYNILGNDGTPFYGEASVVITNNINATSIAIQQTSLTSYSFYYYTGVYPGNGIFTVKSFDTFTYSGIQINPSGCYINPSAKYTVGIDTNGNGNMYVNGIHSSYFISDLPNYIMYDNSNNALARLNAGGSTVQSSLNVVGNISGNNLISSGSISTSTLFASGTISSPLNYFQFAQITNLSVINSFTSNSLLVNGSLNVSGFTTLRSSLLIAQSLGGGDASLKIQNLVSGTSSLYLANNTTLNSRLYSDALGNLNLQAYTSTSNIKFYCGALAYYQITSAGGSNVSDRRFKENIINIINPLELIQQLQGIYFNMINDSKQQLGLIADDVKVVIPQVIVESDDVNYLCYDKLVALLIEGIKEIKSRVEILENKISSIN